jgi:large subunit ribosomal protein L7/L12
MASLSNEEILDAIKQKTMLELNELVKMIQEEFGVTPMAMAAPVAASAAAGTEAAEEEQTQFDVVLTGFADGKKIQVIKAVRELTSLGLKEAKELVETAPKPVQEKVNKEEAEGAKKTLEDAGGSVEVK